MLVTIIFIDKIEPYKHDVKEVITHDNWDGSRYTYPDLALIKLAKKVKFYTERYGRDSVVPVCLSNKNIQKDIFDSEAFVAGKLQSSQKISAERQCLHLSFGNLRFGHLGPLKIRAFTITITTGQI